MTIIKYILYCIGTLLFGGGTFKEYFIGAGIILFFIVLFMVSNILLSTKTEWPSGQCAIFSIFIVVGIILIACLICVIIEAL